MGTSRAPLTDLSERVVRARRRGLDPEERRRVLDAVALRRGEGWGVQFTVMTALSVVVAVMGLSSGSAAVVIGAMLLAPLMVPVMGTAAAIAMALPRHLVRSLGVVVAAAFLAVAGAFVLATMLPRAVLSEEVLARTRPDLRDLFVALAAGAAGSYATVRRELSTSLPGVAVAVALVPPLATLGITLEARRTDLAGGAALLFLANLTAIVFVSVLVFVVTGFVPRRRLQRSRVHVVGGGVLVAAATGMIAVPLTVASVSAAGEGQRRDAVFEATTSWLGGSADELLDLRIEDLIVRVRVSGPNPPPATGDLERTVQQILGSESGVQVRWIQTIDPLPDEAVASRGAETDIERVQSVVAGWLSDVGRGGDRFDVVVDDDVITVGIVSVLAPPSIDVLSARLAEVVGDDGSVRVDWTQLTETGAPSDDLTIDRLRRDLAVAVDEWAARASVQVTDITYDGDVLAIDLAGEAVPDIASLERAVREAGGTWVELEVWFTERLRVRG